MLDLTLGCTHILFVEIDHSLLKSNIFGLISFAKLLKNLKSQKQTAINHVYGKAENGIYLPVPLKI